MSGPAHDRDHSAWWLLWFLPPGLGWLVVFVTVALLGSRPHPNRYGPPVQAHRHEGSAAWT